MPHDVFVSYSSDDKAIADAACSILEDRGIRCWIAPRDVTPGAAYGKEILDAIAGSRVMVLVFSATANSSQHVRREAECAVGEGIAILPLRVEEVFPSDEMRYYLAGQHWLDALTPPLEAHLARMADAVAFLLNPERGRPQATAPSASAPAPSPPAPPPAGAVDHAALSRRTH